jgi:hypothetical protein
MSNFLKVHLMSGCSRRAHTTSTCPLQEAMTSGVDVDIRPVLTCNREKENIAIKEGEMVSLTVLQKCAFLQCPIFYIFLFKKIQKVMCAYHCIVIKIAFEGKNILSRPSLKSM